MIGLFGGFIAAHGGEKLPLHDIPTGCFVVGNRP